MNKQELIGILEGLKFDCPESASSRNHCYNEAINASISLAKQLDEPKKVVVPKFVAEWFENEKNSLEIAINYAISLLNDDEYPFTTEFARWLDNPKNKPLETLIAMKNGYDIEKEQLYYVKMPGVGYLNNADGGIKHTEQEIKAIDERYLAFAVKVDGE